MSEPQALPPECTHKGHCSKVGVEYQLGFVDPDDPHEDDPIAMAALKAWRLSTEPESEKPACPIYWQCRHCEHWTDQEPESYFE